MAWNDTLTRPLLLADGTTLRTLKDAGDCLAERFTTIHHAPPLQDAIVLLMRASASGEQGDIEAATKQMGAVLRIWKLASATALSEARCNETELQTAP